MNWLSVSLHWYFVLFAIGLIFFPLARLLLGRYFFDRGYPFAKTIGIVLLSYTMFAFGTLKIIPFQVPAIMLVIVAFLGLNAYVIYKMKQTREDGFQLFREKKTIAWIVFEELLFLGSFIGYMMIRGQEGSIHGLEKFMDYGFMKSILRTDYFPPLDMWLSGDPKQPAGYFINYYYFGHLTGSFLIKLTQIPPTWGYNFVLGTIFAQGVTLGFSLCSNLVYNIKKSLFEDTKISRVRLLFYGLLGTYFINLGGNLHAIYAFTKGYNPDTPVPFWEIFLSIPEMFDSTRPSTYWYPNATRFIPKTIHEFPSYSYVVADLHGHVYDIPFVLLTLSILMTLLLYGLSLRRKPPVVEEEKQSNNKPTLFQRIYTELHVFSHDFLTALGIHINEKGFRYRFRFETFLVFLLGFMTAIHYMTNALNGPIYLLLSIVIIFMITGISNSFFAYVVLLGFSFFVFSYPFSMNFSPFTSGVGVNCSPEFLVNMQKLGPFLFEKGNCQRSFWWELFVLWGFFWIGLVMYIIALWNKNKIRKGRFTVTIFKHEIYLHPVDVLMLVFFTFGIFLTTIPEFFYVKDIYPDHFRANTMFKLGYQAFIMGNIAMVVTLWRVRLMVSLWRYLMKVIFFILSFFVIIYPFFAFPAYYPNIFKFETFQKDPHIEGSEWMVRDLPQDAEIVEFFERSVPGQPVILEAQGDSYTDYNRISAYTGLPTVAGWWVHEWLWRGSPSVVGDRIPDIEAIYTGTDPIATQRLLQKYNVSYVVISGLETTKYKTLQADKFSKIGTLVFKTKNGVGSVYKINK